ncbi:hypothetical protein B0T11DRAFT_19894 [Plectosphaerella cucumerina]|uniref:Uncharacterized protein n=1 Tax=Plectosphaerella cucumerina TaxID=40658 RepID=A0A8K0TVU2_9PEZI|nr:hypothetical protein B0T11DRAFT_19894 [Plectosphaerella cucumerina]
MSSLYHTTSISDAAYLQLAAVSIVLLLPVLAPGTAHLRVRSNSACSPLPSPAPASAPHAAGTSTSHKTTSHDTTTSGTEDAGAAPRIAMNPPSSTVRPTRSPERGAVGPRRIPRGVGGAARKLNNRLLGDYGPRNNTIPKFNQHTTSYSRRRRAGVQYQVSKLLPFSLVSPLAGAV